MTLKVFVSYSHKDSDIVHPWIKDFEQLAGRHRGEQVEVFFDGKIECGAHWFESLTDALERADLIVVMGSNNFLLSGFIAEREFPVALRVAPERLMTILLSPLQVTLLDGAEKLQWTPSDLTRGLQGLEDVERELARGRILDGFRRRLQALSGRRGREYEPQPERPDADGRSPEIALDPLESLSGCPVVRLFVQSTDRNCFRLEVELETQVATSTGGAPQTVLARPDPVTVKVSDERDPQLLLDGLFRKGQIRTRILNPVRAAQLAGLPVRFHLVLSSSALNLRKLSWERCRLPGLPLPDLDGPGLVFARQFVFPAADHGDLQIKPIDEIDFASIEIDAEWEADPAPAHWISPLRLAKELELDFPLNSTGDGQKPEDEPKLQATLHHAEVLYLALTAGVDDDGDRVQFAWIGRGEGLVGEDVDDLVRLLSRPGKGWPALILLAPLPDDGRAVNAQFAYRLALEGAPAVVAPIGRIDPDEWRALLEQLCADLKRHGVIDLAVAVARRRSQHPDFQLQLYLRSRSARLWYRPGFVTVDGKEVDSDDAWARLKTEFPEAPATSGSIAIIGPAFDANMTISRRQIAENLSRDHGFALARRDQQDLETVSEFIYVSRPRSPHDPENPASEQRSRPHVTQFTEEVDRYLRARLSPHQPPDSYDTIQLTNLLWQRDGKEEDHPWRLLARLRISAYLTVYFHPILEWCLAACGRPAQVAGFRFGSSAEAAMSPGAATATASTRADSFAPGSSEDHRQDAQALSTPSDASPAPTSATVDRPLVYHLFGSFQDADNLVLSKSDYLDFLTKMVAPRDDPTIKFLHRLIGARSLLVLGFRPGSSELRLLLAIYRHINGAFLGNGRMHIAVQIDPEDDHTMRPEGARDFYRGLLSELGRDVYVYWGTAKSFLKALKQHCPDAFVQD
jgi:hypothetical protein